MSNALDALQNEERDIVEKPIARDNLPVQLYSLADQFDFHFIGWYGIYLGRKRGQQAVASAVAQDPVSSTLGQAGIPGVVGLAAVAEEKQKQQTQLKHLQTHLQKTVKATQNNKELSITKNTKY